MSSLLNILAGITQADTGRYFFQNELLDLKNTRYMSKIRRDKIGIIVQNFALIDDLTVFKNVAMPLRYQHMKSAKIKQYVAEMLTAFDLNDKKEAYPDELSGGQQQRTAIARALVKNPELILADEPTGSLDESTGLQVLEIFKRLHKQGKTIVIVTHDQDIAGFCDRVMYLQGGKVNEI